jgi:hypothetical protein
MPLAAAPYRASGLVLWHLADIGVLLDVRFAPMLLKKSFCITEHKF